MNEPIPCSECKTVFEAKDHFCFVCYERLSNDLAEQRQQSELLLAQIQGLNSTVKRLLRVNSDLIQTAVPIDLGTMKKSDY